ncbi:MAG: DEAD/DEAH box helicase family protein [Methanobacteriaceae archaeon]
MDLEKKESFYRSYDLFKCREQKSCLEPVNHQKKALKNLRLWYKKEYKPSGGILALPTGAGKTFVAVRFLCEVPLTDGYKVLWLAHTHHLLEQAFFTFGPKYEKSKSGYEVGFIDRDRETLNVRVVSGAQNNFPPKQIDRNDDIVIGTLQTIRGAYNNELKQFIDFLDSSNDKLFVVFDEAHHAVAPSYRKLIFDLRENYPDMRLLGLTATPTATTENKKIILRKVFPQSVIAESTLKDLMTQKILAWPKFEIIKTNIHVDFEFGDYQRWINTYGDLPQKIVKELAENEDRNKIIAQSYEKDAKKYGKTIIFTDRWYQCVTLCRFLRNRKIGNRNIRADVMFNMVDRKLGTAGTAQRNLEVLEKFKKGQLDVLINIRMLTEGTDVPDANTVFLTRQTTSDILLTQMIGRALRGPEFGGTDVAHIVSFVDNWDYDINWAQWKELPMGPPIKTKDIIPPKVPLNSISIKLVDDAAKRADSDDQYKIDSFMSLMPIGWYLAEFDAQISGDEGFKSVKDFVIVFKHKEENEKEAYDNFIEYLKKEDLELFEGENIEFNSKYKAPKQEKINKKLKFWHDMFFPLAKEDKCRYLFILARHMAQNDKDKPQYFDFKERENHNIDNLAKQYVNMKLGLNELNKACLLEYNREDRYWKAFYPEFIQFKSEVDYWITRILNPQGSNKPIKPYKSGNDPDRPGLIPISIRNKILQRDNFECLCCGEKNKRLLQVDHIIPRYIITNDSEDNLQTLCKYCNIEKGTKIINFRENKSKLEKSPVEFPKIIEIYEFEKDKVKDIQTWQKFLRRKINLFYESNAVKSVNIGKRGFRLRNWEVKIHDGNDPEWIKSHLNYLAKEIKFVRDYHKLKGPEWIKITN